MSSATPRAARAASARAGAEGTWRITPRRLGWLPDELPAPGYRKDLTVDVAVRAGPQKGHCGGDVLGSADSPGGGVGSLLLDHRRPKERRLEGSLCERQSRVGRRWSGSRGVPRERPAHVPLPRGRPWRSRRRGSGAWAARRCRWRRRRLDPTRTLSCPAAQRRSTPRCRRCLWSARRRGLRSLQDCGWASRQRWPRARKRHPVSGQPR